MQTNLSDAAKELPRAVEADAILRNCVHCGFCNATCPTYQLLGNELDGPRGRIYLIKQMLEGAEVTEKTQLHLDRCLTCRNCETTCPSGVKYHALLDIGRAEVERRVRRSTAERVLRTALRTVIPKRALFGGLLRAGMLARPVLPASLKAKVPAGRASPGRRPPVRHQRQVLILEGCVQPSLSPITNAAASRVLDHLGISAITARQAGCCGATDYHLNAQSSGLDRARRNIDAWWPSIQKGVEAIVITASGCGAFVKEYGDLLAADPEYATKAATVSKLARDLVEILDAESLPGLPPGESRRVAVHCPCTLQHAQKLGGALDRVLQRLGFALTRVSDSHLCCGSAGTYSITQPDIAAQLRDRKISALESDSPDVVVTANIGCQMHLNSAGRSTVRHWVELVDELLKA